MSGNVAVQGNPKAFQMRGGGAADEAPPLANTPASGSQQATQLSPMAAPPAECHDREINIGS